MKLRPNAKVNLLRGVPLFAGCSQKELGQIAAIADELYQPEGTTLIAETTRGREFFVLVEGTADVRRAGRRLTTMSGGDFFGEISLITDAPRSATVTATGTVRLLVISGQSFRRLLTDTSAIQAKVLATLADRLSPTVL